MIIIIIIVTTTTTTTTESHVPRKCTITMLGLSDSHCETSFVDTSIRIRDTENDIKPEVTPKYTCVRAH